MTVAPEMPTLDHAVAEVDLFAKISGALRALEADDDVRKVIVSASGVVVVMDNEYHHVALKVVS
jgi:hypothetical protein